MPYNLNRPKDPTNQVLADAMYELAERGALLFTNMKVDDARVVVTADTLMNNAMTDARMKSTYLDEQHELTAALGLLALQVAMFEELILRGRMMSMMRSYNRAKELAIEALGKSAQLAIRKQLIQALNDAADGWDV